MGKSKKKRELRNKELDGIDKEVVPVPKEVEEMLSGCKSDFEKLSDIDKEESDNGNK